MLKFLNKSSLIIAVCLFANCSEILQTARLELDARDNLSQETFEVVEKTLTLSVAKSRNSDPFFKANGPGGNRQSGPAGFRR